MKHPVSKQKHFWLMLLILSLAMSLSACLCWWAEDDNGNNEGIDATLMSEPKSGCDAPSE